VSSFFKSNRNSSAAIIALFGVAFVYLWVALTAESGGGGQDSWNHYLFARWCHNHPKLMLDLWGKPFFTIFASPFAQLGIQAVYFMNIMATLLTAWITYLTGRKMGMRNPWMLILLFGFQPIVLANFYSALTEPTNALVISLILYLIVSKKFATGVFLASFLPLIRSEGMILVVTLLPFLAVNKQLRKLPLLLSGTFVFAVIGAFISGEWNYFFEHNPYIRFEREGIFDPGKGDFLHYFHAQSEITGFWVSLMVIISFLLVTKYIYSRYQKKAPSEMSNLMFWLMFPMFIGFAFAHSFIWWAGILGSHGLLRVFVVVAPIIALIAHYSIHTIMHLDVRRLNQSLKWLTTLGMFFIVFPGAHMPYPWQGKPSIAMYPPIIQFNKAYSFIDSLGLSNNIIMHQLPEVNVYRDWDPFVEGTDMSKYKTLYVWSIDPEIKNDWIPDSTVVIWDNLHARREAYQRLEAMVASPNYKELKQFPYKSKNPNDSIFNVRVFIKSIK